jgi:AraC family transcriptional regulator of adaptative response / DNA-3-methyladenine glycosylase II
VSVAAARTFAHRLVARAGLAIRGGGDGLTHLFPTPASLAGAEVSGLGITRSRAATLHALARAVLEGRIDFGAAPNELVAAMAALPGIGPWTAQYVLMRALAEPDALPNADLVLRRVAGNGAGMLSGRQLEERARDWQPWRSYAVVHLWRAAARAAAGKECAPEVRVQGRSCKATRAGRSSGMKSTVPSGGCCSPATAVRSRGSTFRPVRTRLRRRASGARTRRRSRAWLRSSASTSRARGARSACSSNRRARRSS